MSDAANSKNGGIRFECVAGQDARKVFVAGDFNDWNPGVTRMLKRNGAFVKRINLTPGVHQYKFVVDGDWRPDPAALMQVDNHLGSVNSVIDV